MTDCQCIERTYGRPRPEGSTAHTLRCLLESADANEARKAHPLRLIHGETA